MAVRRSGLGKGLSALIPSEVATAETAEATGPATYLELPSSSARVRTASSTSRTVRPSATTRLARCSR